jgi:hypothetical protein
VTGGGFLIFHRKIERNIPDPLSTVGRVVGTAALGGAVIAHRFSPLWSGLQQESKPFQMHKDRTNDTLQNGPSDITGFLAPLKAADPTWDSLQPDFEPMRPRHFTFQAGINSKNSHFRMTGRSSNSPTLRFEQAVGLAQPMEQSGLGNAV